MISLSQIGFNYYLFHHLCTFLSIYAILLNKRKIGPHSCFTSDYLSLLRNSSVTSKCCISLNISKNTEYATEDYSSKDYINREEYLSLYF